MKGKPKVLCSVEGQGVGEGRDSGVASTGVEAMELGNEGHEVRMVNGCKWRDWVYDRY